VTRAQSVLLGLVAGGAVGALILLAVWGLAGGRDAGERATDRAPGPSASEAPADLEPSSSGPMVRMQPVTIYQRAPTAEVALVGVPAQIVWLDSPAERARQIVRIALEGTEHEQVEAYPPTLRSMEFRDVFIDDRGIAWVDLKPASALRVGGSDEEQALVAVLARSLVEGLDEVRRVGLLVDGEPRRTLAGHVDLERTFDGSEWPLAADVGADSAGGGPTGGGPIYGAARLGGAR
jgi:hypothetical protein